MNTKIIRIATGVAAAVMTVSTMATVAAPAASASDLTKLFGGGGGRQSDKNTMRNVGVGLGAAAAYEALHGKGTNALVLGAGAAYAGKKYEDQRKAQNKDNRESRNYYYRNGRRNYNYNSNNSNGNGNGHHYGRNNNDGSYDHRERGDRDRDHHDND